MRKKKNRSIEFDEEFGSFDFYDNQEDLLEDKTEIESEADDEKIRLPKSSFSYSLICFILIVAFSAISVTAGYINNAVASISLSFSQISAGHNPDGSPFDIYEVMSDEVLESACEKLNNRISVDELRKHLSVTGITTEGSFNEIKQHVLDGNDTYSYFPNRYTITYSIVSDSIKSEGFGQSALAILKQAVLPLPTKALVAVQESYQEYYDGRYIPSNDIFEVDADKIKELDHFNRVADLKNKINLMSLYVNDRYNSNVDYVAKNGVGFGDLTAELNRIISVDVAGYESFVIENGVTVDGNKLVKQFQYVSKMDNEQHWRSMSKYNIMIDGINMYDPNVTKVVFVPSIDSNDDFYMNRTNIGIDYLTENAESAKHMADEAISEAAYYDYLTTRFSSVGKSEQWLLDEAENKIDDILKKLDEFKEKASAVNTEYMSAESYEGVTIGGVGYGQGLIVSGVILVKTVVIWVSLLYALYFIVCLLKKVRQYFIGSFGKEDDIDVGI